MTDPAHQKNQNLNRRKSEPLDTSEYTFPERPTDLYEYSEARFPTELAPTSIICSSYQPVYWSQNTKVTDFAVVVYPLKVANVREVHVGKLIPRNHPSLGKITRTLYSTLSESVNPLRAFIEEVGTQLAAKKAAGSLADFNSLNFLELIPEEARELVSNNFNLPNLVVDIAEAIDREESFHRAHLIFKHSTDALFVRLVANTVNPLPRVAVERLLKSIDAEKTSHENEFTEAAFMHIVRRLYEYDLSQFAALDPRHINDTGRGDVIFLLKNLLFGFDGQMPAGLMNFSCRILLDRAFSPSPEESIDLLSTLVLNNTKVPMIDAHYRLLQSIDWAYPMSGLEAAVRQIDGAREQLSRVQKKALETICDLSGVPLRTNNTDTALATLGRVYSNSEPGSAARTEIVRLIDRDLPFYLTVNLKPTFARIEVYGPTQMSILDGGLHLPRLEFREGRETRLKHLTDYITSLRADTTSFKDLLISDRLGAIERLDCSVDGAAHQDSVNTVSKIASYFITAEIDPETATDVRRAALKSLSRIAMECAPEATAVAARVYLWKIYNLHFHSERDTAVKRILSDFFNYCFNPLAEDVSEPHAIATINSVRHLLAEQADYRLLAILGSYTRNSRIKETRLHAANTLSELAKSGMVAAASSVLEEISNSPGAVGQRIAAQLVGQKSHQVLYSNYCNEVIEPFVSRLKEAAPSAAVYYTVDRAEANFRKCLFDAGAHLEASSTLSDFEQIYRFPVTGSLLLSVNKVKDKEGFCNAWRLFHSLNNTFSVEHGVIPLLLGGNRPIKDSLTLRKNSLLPITVRIGMGIREESLFLRSYDGHIGHIGSVWFSSEPKGPTEIREGTAEALCRPIDDSTIVEAFASTYDLTTSVLNPEITFEELSKQLLRYESKVAPFSFIDPGKIEVLTQTSLKVALNLKDRKNFHCAVCQCESCASSCAYENEIDKLLANIHDNAGKIINTLKKVEPEEVAYAEVVRAIQLLVDIREEKGRGSRVGLEDISQAYRQAFENKVRQGVLSILPRNELVFSLVREALIPSFVSESVIVLVPDFYEKQGVFRDIKNYLGIGVSPQYRGASGIGTNIEFVFRSSSGQDRNYAGGKADVVRFDSEESFVRKFHLGVDTLLYSGSFREARRLQRICLAESSASLFASPYSKSREKRFLLIGSSSGHNPIVITQSVQSSEFGYIVDEVIRNIVKNSGQYCTRASNILIEADEERERAFLGILSRKLARVPIGDFNERTVGSVRVGPLSSATDASWADIKKFVSDHSKYTYRDQFSHSEIIPFSRNFVYPTIFSKPLSEGPEYRKPYAPLFFVQRYEDPKQLMSQYFLQRDYIENAMHVYLFTDRNERGEFFLDEDLVLLKSLEDMKFERPDEDTFYLSDNKDAHKLHGPGSIFHYCTLTSEDCDRGETPFGGYGPGSTYVFHNGTYFAYPQHIMAELCAPPEEWG